MNAPYKLYGLDLSLYSGKVRSYLRYKGIPFVESAPGFFTFYVTIPKHVGDPVVPVVIDPEGRWLQDTSIIIDELEARFPDTPVLPTTPCQSFAAYLFELWGDEFWLPTAMHTRWSHAENYDLFVHDIGEAFLPGFPWWIRRAVVGASTAKAMRHHLPTLGVVPDQFAVLDRWTDAQLDALDAHFAVHPFLFGTRPSLGDFGMIAPLFAHLGRDPWPSRHLIDPRPHLKAWIARMMQPQPRSGEFLDGDRMPETLQPMLRSICTELLAYLEGGTQLVRSQLAQLKGRDRLPRSMPEVELTLGGAPFRRHLMPYGLWMAQRMLDFFRRMPERDAAAVREWLAAIGGAGFLTLDIPRLRRVGLHAALET